MRLSVILSATALLAFATACLLYTSVAADGPRQWESVGGAFS